MRSPDPEPLTRRSFLDLLRDYANEEAWQRFIELYRPLIQRWCRQRGLQEADVDEVTSMVLVKLGERMDRFAYDPTKRFRGWLRTVVDSQVCTFLERARRPGYRGSGSDEVQEQLHHVQDEAAQLQDYLAEVMEPERQLAALAMQHVRERVKEHTWRAFEATHFEERGGAEVAAALGMTAVAVYKARERVVAMIKDEARRLLEQQR